MRRIAVVCLLVGACGGESTPAPVAPKPEPAPAAAQTPKPPPGTLWREDVDAALKAGLGRFLQHVEVEAAFDDGKFVGFRIVRLGPPAYWHGVDLRPDDVVTSVNGMPIERETQAYDAFMTLKTAKELKVKLLRGGAEKTLTFAIVPRKKR